MAVKTLVNGVDTMEIPEYPRLMKHITSSLVVLFTEEKIGFVIIGNDEFKIGISSTWTSSLSDTWEPSEPVTISNV